jgi:uncharacterized MAPEG superfamily protein
MSPVLTSELYWLVLTTLMTGLFWIPYILQRILENGFWPALWSPQGLTHMDAPWAQRMMRAHQNAVENLVIFAPLVLALHVTGANTSVTTTACIVYFFARAAHFVIYTLATPLFRTVVFIAGFAAQMVLALTLLGII